MLASWTVRTERSNVCINHIKNEYRVIKSGGMMETRKCLHYRIKENYQQSIKADDKKKKKTQGKCPCPLVGQLIQFTKFLVDTKYTASRVSEHAYPCKNPRKLASLDLYGLGFVGNQILKHH